mmetsp:Transcript_13544/g.21128  ORF Transcript_13544/g.21128 Transcript_13544/m.21128 type:complete len:99 (+) Transcript_13544:1901-2197(+)
MYPAELRYDVEELDELLTSRIRNLHQNFKPNKRILPQTKEKSTVGKDFLKQYKMTTKDRKPFLVHSLYAIGMCDPYPEDDTRIIGGNEDLAPCDRMPE